MSFNFKSNQKESILVPEGSHIARLYSIVDMGTHDGEYMGVPKVSTKMRFTFELPNETKEFDGEVKPLIIGAEYTMSLSDMSKLKPIVEGILGKKLSEGEKANFSSDDLKKMLGTPCMLTVLHNESKGNIYANIQSVSPLPKGLEAPVQVNPSVIYDTADKENAVFQTLPKFMQEKIKLSHEFGGKKETVSSLAKEMEQAF